jgi:hypothetical protein
MKFVAGAQGRYSNVYVGAIIVSMSELWEKMLDMRNRKYSRQRGQNRIEALSKFAKNIFSGKVYDKEDLIKEDYYRRLTETRKTSHKKALILMKDFVRLANDIRTNGVRSPIDIYREGKGFVIHRGWRRIVIMNELGYKTVCARLYKSKAIYEKLKTPIEWDSAKYSEDSIHNIATKQFVSLGHKSTDKYWVHGYTKLYDKHFDHLRNKRIKVLEIGVLNGASLLLWRDVFPSAQVCGIDKNRRIWQKMLKGKDRIKVFVGRQEDENFLKDDVIPEGPYDIIIDDGSHRPSLQQNTFKMLWPHLSSGGQYVIEDLHGNYLPKSKKRGSFMIDEIKRLVDLTISPCTDMEHFSLTCYYNICFIEKA